MTGRTDISRHALDAIDQEPYRMYEQSLWVPIDNSPNTPNSAKCFDLKFPLRDGEQGVVRVLGNLFYIDNADGWIIFLDNEGNYVPFKAALAMLQDADVSYSFEMRQLERRLRRYIRTGTV